jgi:hypothetical protein
VAASRRSPQLDAVAVELDLVDPALAVRHPRDSETSCDQRSAVLFKEMLRDGLESVLSVSVSRQARPSRNCPSPSRRSNR